MSDDPKKNLYLGMTIKRVRHTLSGWTAQPLASTPSEGGKTYNVWNFISPEGESVRMTFLNDVLMAVCATPTDSKVFFTSFPKH